MIFSRRTQKLTSSAIREILKVTERPEVISFAGGLPAPETFPCERIREVCDRILLSAPSAALQYGPSEGYAALREWIAQHCSSGGRTIDAEQVLVTTGSQQALDLLGKVLVDQERSVLVVRAKQAADLHTPSFTQRIVHEVVKDGFLAAHIPNIRAHYASQCRVMLDALERHFPAQARWNFPEGGMFIWVTLPVGIDSSALLELAIRENVAFVPGAPFYASNSVTNTMRLSFVTVRPERIEEGIARLGKILTDWPGAQR